MVLGSRSRPQRLPEDFSCTRPGFLIAELLIDGFLIAVLLIDGPGPLETGDRLVVLSMPGQAGPEVTACVRLPPLVCLLYTSPSPRDGLLSRMPSSA